MMHGRNFTASGTAVNVDAERLLDRFCSHFAEHVMVTRSAEGARLETVIGSADIALSPKRLDIKLCCPTAAMLFTVRSMVAENLFQLCGGETLELAWSDGPQAPAVPNFRMVTVIAAIDVTLHMRRVTVATDDAAHFASDGLHVRLLIPPKGRVPVWPHTQPDGRIHWPKGDDALTIRAYTIRNIDCARGELDIDFVVHEDGGAGAAWALNARPGDIVGLIGPGGGGVPDTRDMILAGDETALPAIARIMAAMPAEARLRVFMEIASDSEQQELPCAACHEITWFHRNGRPAGTTGLLEKAVREAVAAAGPATFVWAACEQAEARAIRSFLKTDLAYDRDRFSIAAYWQR
jgi:NADPH-dependent ferric siderophore reductase